MTDDQINQAIAEACGIVGKDQYGPLYQAPGGWVVDCPQFCGDLNAMHEAEKVLNTIEQGNYWDHLKDLTDEGFDQLHATARERAEAFLRTLGKWEEVQG